MTYQTIFTNLGLAKIAQAIAEETTVSLATMVLGDGLGNPVEVPNANATDLLRQVWSGALSYLQVDATNPNRFIAEAVVPASVGGFTVREVGILDSNGDLVVNANFPEIYKPDIGEGATRDLVVRIYFEVANADVINLTFDPNVILATRSWVESNFNLAALLPGGLTGQVLRKKTNADGDTEWFDPTSGLNLIVDVVEEQQTLAAAQTIVSLGLAGTDGAAYYIEGVRLHPGDYTVDSATQFTLASAYPAGSKILIVQNDPGSGFQFLRSGANLSDLTNPSTARTNLQLLTDSTYLDELWKLLNQRQYPVGEIYTTRRAGNPSEILGFGTWERFGSGRVLASLDPSDPGFATVDQTGGSKSHILTVGELPSHAHLVNPPTTTSSGDGAHNHLVDPPTTTSSGDGTHNHLIDPPLTYTDTTGAHSHNVVTDHSAASGRQGNQTSSVSKVGTESSGVAGNHSHTVDIPAFWSSGVGNHSHTVDIPAFWDSWVGNHSHTVDIPEFASSSTGSGQAHNNLQPYIVVNVWKRTA